MHKLPFLAQKLLNLKVLIFSFALVFICASSYSQAKNPEKDTTKMNLTYGTNVIITINEEAQFENGLSILLTSFSHKHPYSGGPTKATAYITLSKGNISEEETISVHTSAGKTEEEYDTIHWNNYEIQLKAFDYDKSIEIIVTRMK